MTRITAGRRSKYNAKPVVIDGRRFASTKEGNRYRELKLLEKASEIQALKLQPRFDLCAGFPVATKIGEYRGDFQYYTGGGGDGPGHFVVEDVKSPATRTALFIWKAKHLKAQYGITIREV